MPVTPAHGRALARVLGERPDPDTPAIVFRVGGREIPATESVAFKAPTAAGTLGGVDARRRQPEILVPGDEWRLHGLSVGAFVTVNGAEFEIVSADPSDGDLFAARLRESRL